MTQPLLRVRDLSKHYEVARQGLLEEKRYVRAVNGVSFDIREGETFGLVGESGCGKSTTGQMLVHLVQHTGGQIHFAGRDRITSYNVCYTKLLRNISVRIESRLEIRRAG